MDESEWLMLDHLPDVIGSDGSPTSLDADGRVVYRLARRLFIEPYCGCGVDCDLST
jgi:hypothetical protein